MKETYITEEKIIRDDLMKAQIDNRYNTNMLTLTSELSYNLVLARWGLNYLDDDDVEPFLNKWRR